MHFFKIKVKAVKTVRSRLRLGGKLASAIAAEASANLGPRPTPAPEPAAVGPPTPAAAAAAPLADVPQTQTNDPLLVTGGGGGRGASERGSKKGRGRATARARVQTCKASKASSKLQVPQELIAQYHRNLLYRSEHGDDSLYGLWDVSIDFDNASCIDAYIATRELSQLANWLHIAYILTLLSSYEHFVIMMFDRC